jgi:ATP-binding cassette, subfamily B, bacterial PglK
LRRSDLARHEPDGIAEMISVPRKIWHLLSRGERRSILVLLALILIGNALDVLGIGLVIPAISFFTQVDLQQKYPRVLTLLGDPRREVLIVAGILSLVAIFLVKNVFLAFLISRQTRFASTVQTRLSSALFAIYLAQPYAFHLRRNSAELLRNVNGEVSTLTGNAILPVLLMAAEIFVIVGVIGLLFVVEPIGTLTVAAVMGVTVFGFYAATRRRVMRWGEQRLYHDGYRIQYGQEGFGGAKEAKLLGREAEFVRRYHVHTVESTRANQLLTALQQMPRLGLESLTMIGLALLVFIMVCQGRTADAMLPTLGLFAMAAFRLMPSMNRIVVSVQQIRFSLPAIDNLTAEFGLPMPEARAEDFVHAPLREAIRFDGVRFVFSDTEAHAIDDVSVVIRRGESVGIFGPSGSGKSTFVDVLLGLLMPTQGAVLVDGENIQSDLRKWQRQIGYVPQTIFVADDTLLRNVAFGVPDQEIDERAVLRALRAAQLEELLAALPQGLETRLAERGVRLSGGQRQRIGIARALYHEPSVLVLDEATSALDDDTERGVMEAVDALRGQKTLVIVAHRLSTLTHCDRLYRLEAGRVVEEGTPETLLGSRATNGPSTVEALTGQA